MKSKVEIKVIDADPDQGVCVKAIDKAGNTSSRTLVPGESVSANVYAGHGVTLESVSTAEADPNAKILSDSIHVIDGAV